MSEIPTVSRTFPKEKIMNTQNLIVPLNFLKIVLAQI